ncbi:Alcohol dehydrogenase GroES-like domain-containing protein [Modestobacter sp. DSM 44400]|uniref:NADPH:quinone oxidoreductase family protein n=1 Tax=Modestobacter sp. DSM 44400 TaxID=1550230 RepID=UPI0008973F4D|nr:NADPH:quinone oxidoreductase family protein [Modestobacter sp. DSM 44400]SDY61442.1 Alcohol dehydrogenase GroES-like domain-containing protein [Modestobacter sp. DSM 44400]
MRAALVERFGPPQGLVIGEVPDPVAGHGEILIEVAAAGVNFPDVLVVAGTYQILPARPFSPGKEVAGTVCAVGAGVHRITVGDRVLAQLEHGGYAELAVVAESQVVGLPDGVPFPEAAALGLAAITAHFALVRRAHLRPGETVLVTGAGGGVGSAGVQIAKALGATVVAVARDEQRAALATEQGADHVLLAGPSMREEVMALTDGRGANVVLESVGGDVFASALRCTAWEGRLVVIGFASGELPTLKAGHVLVKNLAVLGIQVSDYRDREPDSVRTVIEELLGLFVQGRLTVPIDRAFPLEEAGSALAAVEAGGLRGRVVLTCRPVAPVAQTPVG